MNKARSSVPLMYALACSIVIGCGSGGGGGLRDPGLSNVQVEVGNARSALIGPEGGTITATGNNGFVYTLTFPPSSVLHPTTIAMYPIKAITNLPQGGVVSGGVNFAPDGLQLIIPATLTIQVPTGIDAKTQFTIGYDGNADKLHPSLGTVTGQTITEQIHHFSGTALAGRQVADLVSQGLPLANDSRSFQRRMADALRNSQASKISPRPDYLLILRNWYDLVVKPALVRGGQASFTSDDVFKSIQEYNVWLDAILYAQLTLGDPAFNVQPENNESVPLAVADIKNWYKTFNDVCVINKDQPLDAGFNGSLPISPLLDAEFAMVAGDIADAYHIPRAANGLDKETLLNNLCVKVKIESKSYSGNAPGSSGDLKVKAGFTIDNGPVRHDVPIRMKISGNGTSNPSVGNSANGKPFSSTVTWPQGVNPLKIDILATLFVVSGSSNDTPDIAVFDRITKTAGSGGLVITPSISDVKIGQPVTLTASRSDGLPLDPSLVAWSAGPASVVTIQSNGATATVTAITAGTAAISVKLLNSNFTATVNVTVPAVQLSGTYVGKGTLDGNAVNAKFFGCRFDVTQAGNQVTITTTATEAPFDRFPPVSYSATLDFSRQNEIPPLILASSLPDNVGVFDLTPGFPIKLNVQLLNSTFGARFNGGGAKTQ